MFNLYDDVNGQLEMLLDSIENSIDLCHFVKQRQEKNVIQEDHLKVLKMLSVGGDSR